MDYQRRFPPKIRRRPQTDEGGCRIKIKKTKNGREIVFKGNCSREQIEIAKEQINLNKEDSKEGEN